MKNQKLTLTRIIVATLLLGGMISVQAEEVTLKIMAPWKSEGQMFRISANEVLIQGHSEGMMYIDAGENSIDALNTAIFQCPGKTLVNMANGKLETIGNCVISRGDEENLIFAEFVCKGITGKCDGKFSITGGIGKFKGITGSGKMIVRTVMTDVLGDVGTGAVLKGSTGLVVWPALKVNIPAK
ncbi:hypothetical protein MNBD_GAMMA25-899 [hydrothermal vent metagenome]|uniref:Uncharacterized protein n=1 Tax=hydrothermal vent metagenome TaxID=652676 RepID=A0A3B1B9N0_9ZZZZ